LHIRVDLTHPAPRSWRIWSPRFFDAGIASFLTAVDRWTCHYQFRRCPVLLTRPLSLKGIHLLAVWIAIRLFSMFVRVSMFVRELVWACTLVIAAYSLAVLAILDLLDPIFVLLDTSWPRISAKRACRC
jgi:hypothetical protein